MKLFYALIVTGALMTGISANCGEARQPGSPRILVAYFSHTNNTNTVAEQIRNRVGGDLFRIEAKNAYSRNHDETVERARTERDADARPELSATVAKEAMKDYDVIFLGFPNWWSTMPMPVFTFLDGQDLAGKRIVPFCTHEGSGLGRSPDDIRRLAPKATLLTGLALRGRTVARAQGEVDAWLRGHNFIP